MGSLRRCRAKQISFIFSQSYWIGKLEETSGILMRSGNEKWKNYFIFSLKERARGEHHLHGFQRLPTTRGQITAAFFNPQLRWLLRELSDHSDSDVTASYSLLLHISISTIIILVRIYYDCSLNCLPLQWIMRSIKARTKFAFFIALSPESSTAPDKGWVLYKYLLLE